MYCIALKCTVVTRCNNNKSLFPRNNTHHTIITIRTAFQLEKEGNEDKRIKVNTTGGAKSNLFSYEEEQHVVLLGNFVTADQLREDQIMYYVWRERLSYNNIKEGLVSLKAGLVKNVLMTSCKHNYRIAL